MSDANAASASDEAEAKTVMKIAITGGTGFVGWHLAERLAGEGHDVVTISRRSATAASTGIRRVVADLSDVEALVTAFTGCDAIAHCAGINREIGDQTYRAVHVDGTRHVVEAARRADVRKVALMSFLRARPNCGSAYHESKWAAEEIVRGSGLDYTVIKAGMVYGLGDHMLDHLSRSLHTIPIFAAVGCHELPIRPLAIDDLTEILYASLVGGRLPRSTVAVTGAEELLLSEAVRRVARVMKKRVAIIPMPVFMHYLLAHVFEWTMRVPLAAWAQVRILAEGVTEAAPVVGGVPEDLLPRRRFTDEQIHRGLPVPGGFTLHDLRCAA